MKTAIALIIGCIVVLSACVHTAPRTPSAAPVGGDRGGVLLKAWDEAQMDHPSEIAPEWTRERYAAAIEEINQLQAELKETKVQESQK